MKRPPKFIFQSVKTYPLIDIQKGYLIITDGRLLFAWRIK